MEDEDFMAIQANISMKQGAETPLEATLVS